MAKVAGSPAEGGATPPGGPPPAGAETAAHTKTAAHTETAAGPETAARLGWLRSAVGRALARFLARQRDLVGADIGELLPGLTAIEELLTTGKRLRPAFCYWGWRGAGRGDAAEVVTAAAALELLHAGALVHDDLIDASDTRRGRPSLHRRFAGLHAVAGWHGSADSFGVGTAIVLGDLLFAWADEMFCTSGLPAAAMLRGQRVLASMRTELMAGQFLDMLEQADGTGTVAAALRVADYKTAKYTVERPLHLGAALAGAPPAVAAAYSAYGRPLGIAFQLRDDVLGVFGDPARTGKPAGDDLREGKRTVLVATAFARASAAQAAALARRLGDPGLGRAGVAEAQEIIVGTGALAECETLIERRVSQALDSLAVAPVTAAARAALAELAVSATARAG